VNSPSAAAPANDGQSFEWLSAADVINAPAPEYLIDGVFRTSDIVEAFGPSGHGKTFVTLSMALSIATATEWYGRRRNGRRCSMSPLKA
jgi:RecA-family ATPase